MSEQRPRVEITKFAPLTLRKNYEDGDFGLLSISVRNGYPRITVFTENKHKGETFDYNKMIKAPFDYITLNLFMNIFEKIIDSDPDTKYQIECTNAKFENGVKTDKTFLESTITIGKDTEGIIYMAVIAEGKRKVKFDLTLGNWHKVLINNEPIADKAAVSKMYAKAYLNTFKKLLGNQLVKDVTAKPTSDVYVAVNTKQDDII